MDCDKQPPLPSRLSMALHPSVVRRALMYAVCVGAILIAINHGSAILQGEIAGERVARMLLTASVPYVVSTLSSVGAQRAGMRALSRQTPTILQ